MSYSCQVNTSLVESFSIFVFKQEKIDLDR